MPVHISLTVHDVTTVINRDNSAGGVFESGRRGGVPGCNSSMVEWHSIEKVELCLSTRYTKVACKV